MLFVYLNKLTIINIHVVITHKLLMIIRQFSMEIGV